MQIFYIYYGRILRHIARPKMLPADEPIILDIFKLGSQAIFAL